MLKCFKVRLPDLMTPAEIRDAGVTRQFDLDTFRKLHRAVTPFQRSIKLAALFTGATQQELAVMEKSEFHLSKGTLDHYRHKSKVRGVYWLPPEFVTLLGEDFGTRPQDPLAGRTAGGQRSGDVPRR